VSSCSGGVSSGQTGTGFGILAPVHNGFRRVVTLTFDPLHLISPPEVHLEGTLFNVPDWDTVEKHSRHHGVNEQIFIHTNT